MESICHAASKPALIAEAFRLLKSGGRLVIYDYMPNTNLTPKQEAMLKIWLEGWAMPSLPSAEVYTNLVRAEGFSKVEVHDITRHILRNRFHIFSRIALPIVWGLHKIQFLNRTRYTNFLAFIYHNRAMREGWARQIILVAYKD
jgi:SAM-dependent methyltransferase